MRRVAALRVGVHAGVGPSGCTLVQGLKGYGLWTGSLREERHKRLLYLCSSDARLHLHTSPTSFAPCRLLPCSSQAVLAARRNMAAVETEKPKSQVGTLHLDKARGHTWWLPLEP